MSDIGDFALGSTLDFKFGTSVAGVPTTLSGTPVISAYVDNSVTQITAGITLTADFDSVTGLNNVRVVATSGNGYAAGSNYQLVITTGTLGGQSVAGMVVGSLSIEARSALRPATAGRTLVVDAAGLADANAVKVGPTGAGTAQTAGDIVGDTNDIQARLPAALVGGRMDASVGAMAANVMTAAAAAADLSAEIADAVWDEATLGHTTAGTFGEQVKTDIDDILVDTAEIGAAGAGLTNINLPDQTMNVTGNITGNLSGSVGSVTTVNDKTGYALSATGSAALTEGYAADGAAPTLNQILYMIWAMLGEKAVSGTTLTTKKLDGTTTSMTFTLDDATSPTSITRAT